MAELTPEEAQALLDQNESTVSDITPYQAQELLAQHEGRGKTPNMFSGAYDILMQGFRSRPSEEKISNLLRGEAAGVTELGRGVANILPNIQQELGYEPIYQPLTKEQFGTSTLLPTNVAQTPEAQRGFALSQLAAASAIPLSEGSLLARALKSFLGGEALAPVFNPDEKISKSIKEALPYSALGAAIEPAIAGFGRAKSGMQTLGGTVKPEEFKKLSEASKEYNIPLGELTGSPQLQGFTQNWMTKTPGTGMAQHYMNLGKQLDENVKDVLSDYNIIPEAKGEMKSQINPLTGEETEPVMHRQTMQEQLSKNFQENVAKNRKTSNELYAARDKEASNFPEGFKIEETKKIADEELKNLERRAESKGFEKEEGGKVGKYTRLPKEIIKELEAASKNNKIDFKDLNFNKSEYSDLIKEMKDSHNNNGERIMKRLSAAYEKDVKNALNQPGREKLKDAQARANEFYQERLGPIEQNKSLRKHSKSGLANPNDFIRHVVSNGKYDNPDILRSVMKNLSPEYRKQFTHEYMTHGAPEISKQNPEIAAEVKPGEVNVPQKEIRSDQMLRIYSKLKPDTKKILFPSTGHRDTLDKALLVRGKLGGSIHQMVNPKTGFSALSVLGPMLGLGGATGLSGAAMHLGLPPEIAVPGGIAATGAMGKALTKYLTSPKSRERYLKGAEYKEKPYRSKKSPSGIAALLSKEDENE